MVGVPWVIENVMGAGLDAGWLCGTMFELPFFRHRVFETTFPWMQPGHPIHRLVFKRGGLFGSNGGRLLQVSKLMGIDWMKRAELTQAIPPVYTEYIGRRWLEQVGTSA